MIWMSLTQFRREVLDDGSGVMVEPDKDAVRTVLGDLDVVDVEIVED